MTKLIVFLGLYLGSAIGQTCVEYGRSTVLSGTLLVNDEAGYNQFIAVRLKRPFCVRPDPPESAVRVIQAGVYGDDAASETLRDRLDRLVGHSVVIKGVLFGAHTGYHRTNVQLSVESVDAADARGRQALIAPRPRFTARDVASYDVTINAQKRFEIEVHESASTKALRPGDKYISRWMTGGEVLYVDCLDGYERGLISDTQDGGGFCFDGDLCGFSAFPAKAVTIKFRCTRKPGP